MPSKASMYPGITDRSRDGEELSHVREAYRGEAAPEEALRGRHPQIWSKG